MSSISVTAFDMLNKQKDWDHYKDKDILAQLKLALWRNSSAIWISLLQIYFVESNMVTVIVTIEMLKLLVSSYIATT